MDAETRKLKRLNKIMREVVAARDKRRRWLKRCKLTEEQMAEVVRRYQDGETIKELENRFGVSNTVIRTVFKVYEIKSRQATNIERIHSLYQDVVDDYNSGKEVEWICENHDISQYTLYNILHSQKVKCRLDKASRDITGAKYEMLTAVEFDAARTMAARAKGSRKHYWWCRCDCGNPQLVSVDLHVLELKRTKSCGCLLRAAVSKTHTKHGLGKTKEYRIWCSMRDRCLNAKSPSFPNYGGRGICVDQRWVTDFLAFLNDLGKCPEGHSLERIDVNKGYTPTNCCWATRFQQANNTRKNRRYTYGGKSLTIGEWSKLTGIKYGTINSRIRYGWTMEDVLTASVGKNNGVQPRRTREYKRLYGRWCCIKSRCTNPRDGAYKSYGEVGITICERWKNWDNFYSDVGFPPYPKMSIDRVDGTKGYWCGLPSCPECSREERQPNCRWATGKQQNNNKKNNTKIEYKGQVKSLAEWCESLGVTYNLARYRYQSGWSASDIFEKPSQKQCSQSTVYQPECV